MKKGSKETKERRRNQGNNEEIKDVEEVRNWDEHLECFLSGLRLKVGQRRLWNTVCSIR